MCRHSTTLITQDAASTIITDEQLLANNVRKGASDPEPELESEMFSIDAQAQGQGVVPRRDIAAQKAAALEAKRKSHEEWVHRNEPKQLTTADRKHALRMLVLESAKFHKHRRSAHLHATVRDIVAGCRPDLLAGVPEKLSGLSPQLAQILFADLDTLLTRKGGAVALGSLMELPLWQTRARGCPLKAKYIDTPMKRAHTPAPPATQRPPRPMRQASGK